MAKMGVRLQTGARATPLGARAVMGAYDNARPRPKASLAIPGKPGAHARARVSLRIRFRQPLDGPLQHPYRCLWKSLLMAAPRGRQR